MKAAVAAFNQEKALVGAFSVITNLRIAFVWTSTGRRRPATIKGGDRGRARSAHRANIVLQVVDAGESPPCWTPWPDYSLCPRTQVVANIFQNI